MENEQNYESVGLESQENAQEPQNETVNEESKQESIQDPTTDDKNSSDDRKQSQQGNMIPEKRFKEVTYKYRETERQLNQLKEDMKALTDFKSNMESKSEEADNNARVSSFKQEYADALDNGDNMKAAEIQARYIESLSLNKKPITQNKTNQPIDTGNDPVSKFHQKYERYTNDPVHGSKVNNLIYKTNDEFKEFYRDDIESGSMTNKEFMSLLDLEVARKLKSSSDLLNSFSPTSGTGTFAAQKQPALELTSTQKFMAQRLFNDGRTKTLDEAYKIFAKK
jgi:hypothetical protein